MTTRTEKPRGWRDIVQIHPAADVFPLMNDGDLAELAADIKANGLQNPVLLSRAGTDAPLLIDGRNRLDAMEDAGIPLITLDGRLNRSYTRTVTVPPGTTTVADLVVALNIRRRHLSPQERADLAARAVVADGDFRKMLHAIDGPNDVVADGTDFAAFRKGLHAGTTPPAANVTSDDALADPPAEHGFMGTGAQGITGEPSGERPSTDPAPTGKPLPPGRDARGRIVKGGQSPNKTAVGAVAELADVSRPTARKAVEKAIAEKAKAEGKPVPAKKPAKKAPAKKPPASPPGRAVAMADFLALAKRTRGQDLTNPEAQTLSLIANEVVRISQEWRASSGGDVVKKAVNTDTC